MYEVREAQQQRASVAFAPDAFYDVDDGGF